MLDLNSDDEDGDDGDEVAAWITQDENVLEPCRRTRPLSPMGSVSTPEEDMGRVLQ